MVHGSMSWISLDRLHFKDVEIESQRGNSSMSHSYIVTEPGGETKSHLSIL